MTLAAIAIRYQHAVSGFLATLPPGTAPAELTRLNYELSAALAKAEAP